MKRYEIHASIVTTSVFGNASAEHVVLEIEAMLLNAAIAFARAELHRPHASVFIDRDECREVVAA